MARIDQLLDYYAARLGILYRSRPKADATVRLCVKQALADDLANDLEHAFDITTAVGPQLDTIGKYIGAPRNVVTTLDRPYFGFQTYSLAGNNNGFQDYEIIPDAEIGFVGGDNFDEYIPGSLPFPVGGTGWAGPGFSTIFP